ncbi:FkbM family methyltransferase [Paracoccus beibuensis]|uniref:FkbM family methyltransferase n=1 Tax=Paracoccus beibuensis TaxID=547602 RepID=UPI00223FC28B|nr:FkbM family methyltransferase [Paracoccus beibuensis]
MGLRTWLGLIRSLAIYYNPVRQRQLRTFYRGLLSPGQLAFDIGAHVGSRARAMRSAGARVVACEPQEPFAGFLQRSLPRDIVLVQKAVGQSETVAEMAVSSLHPTVSSLSASFAADAAEAPGFGHVRWDRRQRVQVTTLDRLIAEHGLPDLVKIDVEGFELDVLAGLSQPLPLVSVEYLPGLPERSLAVIDRLTRLGDYRFNPVAGEDARFLWPDWRDAGAVRAWLRSLPRDGMSGDLYARVVSPD